MLDRAQGVGAEAAIADLSLEFVFGKVWSRDGLDRKQRSLVTIAALIAFAVPLAAKSAGNLSFTIPAGFGPAQGALVLVDGIPSNIVNFS